MTTTLLTLCLAVSAFQAAEKTIDGTVVDANGKPIAGAEVVATLGMNVEGAIPVYATAKTAETGRFELPAPNAEQRRNAIAARVSIWAAVPGKGIAATQWSFGDRSLGGPIRLDFDKPSPRSVRVETADGKPLAGARVVIRRILLRQQSMPFPQATLPDDWGDRVVATTDETGVAALPFINGNESIICLRVSHPTLAAEDFSYLPLSNETKAERFTIRLGPLGRLEGKIVVEGAKPAGPIAVEVWKMRYEISPATFEQGAIVVAADGSFATPKSLVQGDAYRLVVRAQGLAPAISPWVKLDQESKRVETVVLKPFRTIRGKVVDRQANPVADVEVFQSGDGPARTSTRTDKAGRFTLDGFARDRTFVFANKEGFRFQGKDVDTSKNEDAEIVLTRSSETSENMMKLLTDDVPRAERVAIARRILAPTIDLALNDESKRNRYYFMYIALSAIDPAEAIRRLDRTELESEFYRDAVRAQVAIAIAQTDVAEAEATIRTIKNAELRSTYEMFLSDELPESALERKLAMLDQAVLSARTLDPPSRVNCLAQAALRQADLGESRKANDLLDETLKTFDGIPRKSDQILFRMASAMTIRDPAKAVALFETIPDGAYRELSAPEFAERLALVAPDRAERFATTLKLARTRDQAIQNVCRVSARRNPSRARALAESVENPSQKTIALLFAAVGSLRADKAAAIDALRRAEEEMLKLDEGPNNRAGDAFLSTIVPVVEMIDPALVPEFLWRALSLRRTGFEPRVWSGFDADDLFLPVAWAHHDRRIAALLAEPIFKEIDNSKFTVLVGGYPTLALSALSLLDLRRAVDFIEALPMPKPGIGPIRDPMMSARMNFARELVTVDRYRQMWIRLPSSSIGRRLARVP